MLPLLKTELCPVCYRLPFYLPVKALVGSAESVLSPIRPGGRPPTDDKQGSVLMPLDPDTDGSDDDCLFEPLDTHYSHLAAARAPVDLR